jgi:hypothetical protein
MMPARHFEALPNSAKDIPTALSKGQHPLLPQVTGQPAGSRACMMTAAWPVLPARPRVWQLGGVCLPGCPGGSC